MFWDIHTHTSRYSGCAHHTPEELVDAAKDIGLGGIVLTEHRYVWQPEELAQLQAYAGSDLLVLAGGEASCHSPEGKHLGDYLVFGLASLEGRPGEPKALIEWVHQQEGLIIAAHPYRPSSGCKDLIYELDVDAVEVWNPNHLPDQVEASRQAALALSKPMTAASDAHWREIVGYHVIEARAKITDMSELMRVIRAGDFHPRPFYQLELDMPWDLERALNPQGE
jgi:predicted metal-dependent phosphoesterase TrpH